MKVPKQAWQTGALWTSETSRGFLEAIIVGPSGKSGHKIVWMKYTNESHRYGRHAVQGEYSHRHMLKHFKYTGETRAVPALQAGDLGFGDSQTSSSTEDC